MQDKVIELRKQGLTYSKIAKILNCSKSNICYYLGHNQKEKTLTRTKKYRIKQHPFDAKLSRFINRAQGTGYKTSSKNINKLFYDKIKDFFRDRKTKMYNKPTFTISDIIKKFGEHPVCYLTGQPIDVYKPSTYWFDHIIPVSRGGDNSLDNLGICSKKANIAKSDMTPDEFVHMCQQVLKHQGYQVSK